MTWFLTNGITIGSTQVSYVSIAVACVVLIFGFGLTSRLVSRLRRVSGAEDSSRWRAVAAQVVGYGLRFVTVASALQITGVDVASLLAAGAVLAVGIGIAMQKVAENFVSGVILFAERSIREGDILEIDGRVCKVQHMGIRATVAQTLDDEEIIVPNSLLAQSAVKNLTLSEPLYRLRVRVGVAYETDVDHATSVLQAAAEAIPAREPTRDPVVLLLDFGTSSLDFEVSVWTRDVWGLRRGQSALRVALWRALRDASITIPFPQLDLHVKASQEAAC